MPEFAYVVEVSCAGLEAEVRLNDWPVFRRVALEARTYGAKVNPFIVEGKNRLDVGVGPLPSGLVAEDEARLDVKVYKTEHGTASKDDDVLVHYRWTAEESPLAAEGTRRVFSHGFDFRKAFGRWGWERAKRFMPEDEPAIAGLVSALHRALAQRDATGALALVEPRVRELARSVDLTPEEQLQKQLDFWGVYFASPAWVLDPFDPAKLSYESAAGGRLVLVTGPEGASPITGSAIVPDCVGPYPFELDLTVSHIDGSWQVVR
jgi:hypothetical protein